MSLEQAVDRLVEAITKQSELTSLLLKNCGAVYWGDNTPQPAPAPAAEPAKRGPGRPKKEAAEPAPAARSDLASADGTTYWINTKHDAAYRIVPGDGATPLPGSDQISEADFLAHRARLDEKYKTLPGMPGSPVVIPPTAAAPWDDAPAPSAATFQEARTALLSLAKAKANGRDLVMAILKKHGVNSVPELATKTPEVFAAVVAEAIL